MYYIRKGNKVFRRYDIITGPMWSEITYKTTRIGVCVFTTRKDAQNFVQENFIGMDVEVSNNLDYYV